uniref:Uncharacterized protein n=1 Tax=Schizaphis graminum TaxID=13262 RepID=A0A2S2NPE6_SCHGA
MDMKSFAIKLIITIITFILIFDDASAGCLESLTDAGYPECSTGDQNYAILVYALILQDTIIDFRNYANEIEDYLKIIKAMHPSDKIAQAYCMKLLDEKNEDKEVLSSTSEFCKQYKE